MHADRELVDLEIDPDGHRSRFVVEPSGRPDGGMYGGAGIAAAVLAMEAATERSVMWVTTQFVRAPTAGQVVELRAEVLADGGRTAQIQVTATVDGEVAFLTLGSVGRPRPDGLTGQYATMPAVSPPERSTPGGWAPPRPTDASRPVSYLEAEPVDEMSFGHLALWVRRRGGEPFSAAALAYAADMVPVAVARAAGRLGAGSSLDNSLRFGDVGEHEWVLLELAGDLAHGGYGHGSLRAWAADGTLLGTGGQSSNMRYLFDEGALPPSAGRSLTGSG